MPDKIIQGCLDVIDEMDRILNDIGWCQLGNFHYAPYQLNKEREDGFRRIDGVCLNGAFILARWKVFHGVEVRTDKEIPITDYPTNYDQQRIIDLVSHELITLASGSYTRFNDQLNTEKKDVLALLSQARKNLAERWVDSHER